VPVSDSHNSYTSDNFWYPVFCTGHTTLPIHSIMYYRKAVLVWSNKLYSCMMYIQFNSTQLYLILYYLCAESTTTRPITDTAQTNITFMALWSISSVPPSSHVLNKLLSLHLNIANVWSFLNIMEHAPMRSAVVIAVNVKNYSLLGYNTMTLTWRHCKCIASSTIVVRFIGQATCSIHTTV
jgi:hypothetical protein